MNDFIKYLNDLTKEIESKIKFINHGGCGFTAFYFYKHLSKLKLEDVSDIKIKTSDWNTSDVESLPLKLIIKFFKRHRLIPKSIEEYEKVLRRFDLNYYNYNFLSHLVCTFKYQNTVYVIDINYGVLPLNVYTKESENKLSDQYWDTGYLIRLLNEKNNWNDLFDRSNLKILNEIFKRVGF